MSTQTYPTPISGRRWALGALAVVAAALLAGCVAEPVKEQPKAEAIPYFAPQLPFASSSQLPADPTPTAETTEATLAADLSSQGAELNMATLLNASQGGYAATRNLNWLPGQTAQMSSMGLNEIRIDHVFDDDLYHVVNVGPGGAITYDFTALDRVLLPLVENGLQPFISLSYMPSALGKSLYGPPSSMAAWTDAVAALVGHYRDLGYPGWGYEVWNEPDTYHWTGTSAQYNELYGATARAVKTADPTALVGGGATSSLQSEGSFGPKFIGYLGANSSVPADFFSVHAYWAGDWPEMPETRNLLDAAGRVGLPIYVTEWSALPDMEQGAGNGSDSNSSNGGSTFAAKRIYLAIESHVAKAFYFSPIEGYKHNLPYNGDLGLVTVDGHRKSPGNVFELFSRLSGTRVTATLSGPGTDTADVYGIVTTDASTGKSVTLLWNNTPTDVSMAIDLTGLPYEETNYRVSERVVSATQGNGIADGSDVVVPVYPSASENVQIVSDEVHEAAEDYSDTLTVPANGVVSVEIEPSSAASGTLRPTAQPAQSNLAALAAGATATASSSLEQSDQGWGVGRLTDGRRHGIESKIAPIRGWASETHAEPAATEWLQVDLGSAKPVDTVVLWPRDSQQHQGAGFPDDFTIEGSSDGAAWEIVATRTAYTAGEAVVGAQSFDFPAAEFRYLRVVATQLTDSARTGVPAYGFQLSEVEAYRNGVVDGGFESGALDAWQTKGGVEVQPASVRSGLNAVKLTAKGSSITARIEGILPNTTYTFGGHLRLEKSDDTAAITVSEFGAPEREATVNLAQWSPAWVTFTTGPKHTSAVVEFSKKSGSGSAWGDDFVLTQGATTTPERAK